MLDYRNEWSSDLSFLNSPPKLISNITKIICLSCNNRAAIFESEDGLLYSLGDDNKTRSGILGLGDIYKAIMPTIIKSLLEKKIVQISVGFNHCTALDSNGNIYTWGSGYGIQQPSNLPLSLKIEKIDNVREVLSTRNATIILTGKLKLKHRPRTRLSYWFIKTIKNI